MPTIARSLRSALASFALASAIFLGACAATHPDPGSLPLSPDLHDKYVQSFDTVWQTIKDKHFDPTLNGADWNAARAELRPKVEAAKTPDEARAVLNQLIERLGQSHFGVIPADVYAKQKAITSSSASSDRAAPSPSASTSSAPEATQAASADEDDAGSDEGSLGIDLRLIDNKPVVFRVDDASAGASAGVQPGWILTKINGTPIDRRIERLNQVAEHSTISPELIRTIVLSHQLRGAPGKSITLDFLDAHDKPVTLALKFDKPAGVDATLGNLVGMRMKSETRLLAPGIQYFAFSMFGAPRTLMPEFSRAVDAARQQKGLIIDLRGNPGGVGAMAMGMGGFFVTAKDQKLGTMITRDAKLNFILNPRLNPYSKPVAILIDGGSASTSEILAGGLQDLHRARVFGTRSAGAALPSVITKLPSGDGFQYAFANYISVGGQTLEGKGVTPDEAVPLTRAGLLSGKDDQIDAAIRWILSQNAAPGAS
jgi:carboxyl-terminal processing protease